MTDLWQEVELLQTILFNLCSKWYSTSPITDDITYSTHSIFIAFSLLYFGSSNETKKQLGETFGFSKFADGKLEKVIHHLIHEQSSEVIITIANGLWLSNDLKLKKEYAATIQYLEATLKQVNFAQSEEVREDINAFVAETTHNVIRDFLQPGTITAQTVSAIVNAIYFKGTWKEPFDLMDEKLLFNNKEEVVAMKKNMRTSAIFNDNYTAVSIPYSDSDHSFVVVMPKDMEQFKKEMKENKSETYLKEIFMSVRQEMPEKREVTIPKFKIESSMILNEQLKQLGVVDVFGANADFSAMTDDGKIAVSSAIHKCVVDVNEKGTEAAAATGIMMVRMCMMLEEPRNVIIDKPFFFAIIGGEFNIPYFFGQITHPQYQ